MNIMASKLLLLAAAGGALLLLGSRKAKVVMTHFVDDNDTSDTPPLPQAQPAPPSQGNSFRVGPQPDPTAPNDANRGRTFLVMEQSRQSGSVGRGSIPLANLPQNASGRIEVKMWATRAGHPNRCSLWVGTANVSNGRIVAPGQWTVPKPIMCGTEHAMQTDEGGCTLKQALVQWEQQGPAVALTWRTEVGEGNILSDQDCDEDLEFYVDAFWKYIAT